MRRSPARGPVLGVAMLTLALAACEGGPSPRERLEAAAEATAAEKTSAFTFEVRAKMARDSVASGMRMTGEGAYDRDGRRGHVTFELPAMGLSMEMISRGDTAYVQIPAAVIGEQNQWLKATTDDTLDAKGALDSLAYGPLLDAAAGEITTIGTRQIQGVQMEGLGFTVSASRLRDQLVAVVDTAIVDTAATVQAEGPDADAALDDLQIPVEVWLDAEDRIRRIVATVDMDPVVEGARGAMSDTLSAGQRQAAGAMLASMADSLRFTVELSDFGTEVKTAVPEDAEIMTFDELREKIKQAQIGVQPGRAPTGTGGG